MIDSLAVHGAGANGLTVARPFPTTGYAPIERTLQEIGSHDDRVEFSETGRLLGQSGDDAPIGRTQRIAALRAAISNGSYETPEKLEIALDAAIADLL
ncbi:MAG: flagellar biosynthesis anti-sigma factor FlgM [Phycisphaerae bacterium]